jgi:hypothetical protein
MMANISNSLPLYYEVAAGGVSSFIPPFLGTAID